MLESAATFMDARESNSMDIPKISFLEFSHDDPLWVCRVSHDDLGVAARRAPGWARSGAVAGWEITDDVTEAAIWLQEPPEGAMRDGHGLVQGINGTGLVTTILHPVDQHSFIGNFDLESTWKSAAMSMADRVLSRYEDDFETTFHRQMKSRQVDVTVLEEEHVAFIHFPIWLEADAPEDMSLEEKIQHKERYVEYAWAKTITDRGFLPAMLESMCDDILQLSPDEAEKRHTVRSYGYRDDKFVDLGQQHKLSDFRSCSCDRMTPTFLKQPTARNLSEACEILVCEFVNGVKQCRLVSIKPYAN